MGIEPRFQIAWWLPLIFYVLGAKPMAILIVVISNQIRLHNHIFDLPLLINNGFLNLMVPPPFSLGRTTNVLVVTSDLLVHTKSSRENKHRTLFTLLHYIYTNYQLAIYLIF
jgi:hypothetical protein